MTYKDEELEEEESGRSRELEESEDEVETPPTPWGEGIEAIKVETGRGEAVDVAAGSPFVETIHRIAVQANYGRFFRVFLNGVELLDTADAPQLIEPGMRIAVTPYDKVG